MKKILLIITVIFIGVPSLARDLCEKYDDSGDVEILKSLADKLSYSYEEFCFNKRILDIQKEIRNYYYEDVREYERHQVMTLHYNEYSCEYHYNLQRKTWMSDRQYCYGTW